MISYLLCLFITPCIRLKLHSHSSIVLKTLSEQYPFPSSSEDEQWLDPGLPIGKNGELHRTQEDKHIFILPHFTTIRSDQIDYLFFPHNQWPGRPVWKLLSPIFDCTLVCHMHRKYQIFNFKLAFFHELIVDCYFHVLPCQVYKAITWTTPQALCSAGCSVTSMRKRFLLYSETWWSSQSTGKSMSYIVGSNSTSVSPTCMKFKRAVTVCVHSYTCNRNFVLSLGHIYM